MKEIKNQPIDARSKKPFYIRTVCAVILFPLSTVLLCLLLRPIADKLGFEAHIQRLTVVLIAVMALMLIRYLYRNNIRKWCCAYINYVYDCMEREDTDHCPRCQSVFAAQYGETDAQRECPNKNCGLSLKDKLSYSKLPATVYGAKALVLNAGVRHDFAHSTARDIWQCIVSLAVYAAVSVVSVYFIAPRVIDAVKQLIDLF